jgi:hypothetical protein
MFSVRAGAARIDPLRGTLSVVPLAPVDQPARPDPTDTTLPAVGPVHAGRAADPQVNGGCRILAIGIHLHQDSGEIYICARTHY